MVSTFLQLLTLFQQSTVNIKKTSLSVSPLFLFLSPAVSLPLTVSKGWPSPVGHVQVQADLDAYVGFRNFNDFNVKQQKLTINLII